MMDPITVPFAPTPYKIVAGVPLLILSVLAFYWGAKNLRLCVQILQGKFTASASKQPSLRSRWRAFLCPGSGGGCGYGAFLRSTGNDPADNRFAGWHPRRCGTASLSPKIYFLA